MNAKFKMRSELGRAVVHSKKSLGAGERKKKTISVDGVSKLQSRMLFVPLSYGIRRVVILYAS